jgi:chromate transporter
LARREGGTVTEAAAPIAAEGPAVRPTFGEAARVWAKIGLLSFGGPAGQIALMHRVLVDERRWISEPRFLHALNFCMLLPGPEAQQLATYVGWLLHGVRGGLVAGALFVLPGAAAMLVLSVVYALYGSTALLAGLFFGLKAAVLAIVVQAVVRIGRRALTTRPMQALAATAFVAIFALHVPFPVIVLGAALIGYVATRGGSTAFRAGGHGESSTDAHLVDPPAPRFARTLAMAVAWIAVWLAPAVLALAIAGPDDVFTRIAGFFSVMAVVTFGGAYAVLAYVAQAAVATYGWLAPGEMLDGLGLAETTPGPLILVLEFVGFLAAFRDPGPLPPLLAGVLGAGLTLWVTFVPSFLWIFVGAPYVERLRGNAALAGALSAVTAAVVGVILNLAVWFALHTVFSSVERIAVGPLSLDVPVLASLDPWALLLALAAAIAVFCFRLGLVPVLGGSALAGLVIKSLVG